MLNIIIIGTCQLQDQQNDLSKQIHLWHNEFKELDKNGEHLELA